MDADALTKEEGREEGAALVASLFEQYAEAICAYLYALLGDWEVACDCTQDTFLRLLRMRSRLLNEVENHRAWTYRIATHIAQDVLKRRRRFAWLPWRQQEHLPQLQWRGVGETLDEQAAVEQALYALPPSYRIPLVLYSYYGFPIREVAAILELGEGAVKMRLSRAREMFRQAYQQEDEP